MSDPIVEVEGLWKTFGDVSAVEDFSFAVQRGQVYGLLGPNGAGKTTTLRVLMGLERATRGTAHLFGELVTPGCRQLVRVGAMVEQAAFIPHLSGMRNLRLWWEAGGARMKDADLDGALAIAGLDDAIDRRVKTYSQGMKQRLGFARLLLGRPELLVLDEPTNGLDPAGRDEMLALVRRTGTEFGIAVIVASHLLGEIERVCDFLVAIDAGRLLRAAPLGAFTERTGVVAVEVEEGAAALMTALVGRGLQAVADGRTVLLAVGEDAQYDVIRDAIAELGLPLVRLEQRRQSLEDLFRDDLPGGAS